MDDFIERFKRWLDQEKENGNISDWGLIEPDNDAWGAGVEVGEDEYFVTIEIA